MYTFKVMNHAFTDYQLLVLAVMALMNMICGFLLWFVCYALIRFPKFREGLTQAIQNGDEIFHWIDAKSFGFFVAGYLSAWFTMNIAGIIVFAKMFGAGEIVFIGVFISVTFALWGIAWKK